jgi:hypothetical protein
MPPACRSGRSIRSRTAPSRSACAPGWRRRRAEARLCRAALYLRRPRPPCAPGDTGPHVFRSAISRSPASGQCPAGLRARRRGLRPWYDFFPWEDWRERAPGILDEAILPPSLAWAKGERTEEARRSRAARLCFGDGGSRWDEEKVLDRYELLYERRPDRGGARDGREAGGPQGSARYAARRADALRPPPHSRHRHRAAARQAEIPAGGVRADAGRIHAHRIAAHGGGDFRPPSSQAELPQAGGRHGELVEPTGETPATATGGRPAALFRFRREVLQERPRRGCGSACGDRPRRRSGRL